MYALEATEYAQRHGKFMEFHQAAYQAFWSEGKDLGDLQVIGGVGAEVGLDSADLVKTLEDQQLSSVVMGQYQQALQYGIRGIPTFLVGNLLYPNTPCLLYTSPRPRDRTRSRMPSSA